MIKTYHFIKRDETRTWGLQNPHCHAWGGVTYFLEDQAIRCVNILKDKNLPAYPRKAKYENRDYNVDEYSHNVYVTFDNDADEAEFIMKYNDEGIEINENEIWATPIPDIK